jgi:hypothetical protein
MKLGRIQIHLENHLGRDLTPEEKSRVIEESTVARFQNPSRRKAAAAAWKAIRPLFKFEPKAVV